MLIWSIPGVEGSMVHLDDPGLGLKQNLAHLDEVAAAQKHHLAHLEGHLDDHLAHKEHLEGKVEGKQGFRVPFHLPALMGQPPNKYEEEDMVH